MIRCCLPHTCGEINADRFAVFSQLEREGIEFAKAWDNVHRTNKFVPRSA
ncbi:hypothetical protein [uncultured Ruminococcus sp.]|nr:hypothetical protein [uncultured Ruminococcus sp.]